ncbi:MAG TPA: SAM-dependent chlorinase/fluorinase [Chloroflexota bacterium]|nr:SAM-dependent chlorinase/fluorinase [Chloroflexota bacterium]
MEARQPNRPVVGLLTDFGLQDHYVGVVKGVIAGIAPGIQVVDISHAVTPQSILAGQRLLLASVPYFPPGSVFLAVVDPGVGTARRPLALRSAGCSFVGPDNGLFTPWLESDWQAVELIAPALRLPVVSSTFHGRDVFAPAAAHLALGMPLERFGPRVTDPVRLLPPEPLRRDDGTIVGEVVYADHFGNLITNVRPPSVSGAARFRDRQLRLAPTYGSAAPGELLALLGSEGELELAIRDGNAAQQLQASAGERVEWLP